MLSLPPKPFKSKDRDPETLLIGFDLYIKTIKNFFIATGRDGVNSKQQVRRKVALLQAVGGPDMVEEVGKVVLVAVTTTDAANNNVAAVSADTFEQAVEKIRNGIIGKTNQAEVIPTDGPGQSKVRSLA